MLKSPGFGSSGSIADVEVVSVDGSFSVGMTSERLLSVSMVRSGVFVCAVLDDLARLGEAGSWPVF